MRSRWLLKSLLVVAILGVLGPTLLGLHTICHRKATLYAPLDRTRTEARQRAELLRAEIASGETFDVQAWAGSVAAAAYARVVDGALVVKGAVAYPGHVVAGFILEAARCPAGPTADQWLKAGMHAPGDRTARWAAAGLRRTIGVEQARREVTEAVEQLPWFRQNLARVGFWLEHAP